MIWSDTVQFLVLLGGLLAALHYSVSSVEGGFAAVVGAGTAAGKFRFLDLSTSLETEFTAWSGLIGGAFLLLSQYVVDQAELQRFLTTSSVRGSRRALVSTMVFTSIYGLVVFSIGTALYVHYSHEPSQAVFEMEPDRVFPMSILDTMPAGPAGLRGLLLAGIFAAAMSTVSSILNCLATVTVRDILGPLARTSGSVRLARWATVAYGCLATALSLRANFFGTVLIAQGKIRNFFGGSLVGVFLLGMLSRRANASGALWSIVVSFAATALLAGGTDVSWMWYSVFSAAVSYAVGGCVSRASAAPNRDRLDGLVWKGNDGEARTGQRRPPLEVQPSAAHPVLRRLRRRYQRVVRAGRQSHRESGPDLPDRQGLPATSAEQLLVLRHWHARLGRRDLLAETRDSSIRERLGSCHQAHDLRGTRARTVRGVHFLQGRNRWRLALRLGRERGPIRAALWGVHFLERHLCGRVGPPVARRSPVLQRGS